MGRRNRRGRAHDKGQGDYERARKHPKNPLAEFLNSSYRPPSGHHRKYKQGWDNAKKQHRKGGCFITTACVEARGLPDDCLELTTLRNFRDGYIGGLPDGGSLVDDYYDVAPRIVAAVERREDAHDLFCRIYEDDIVPTVNLVLAGDSERALSHYKSMVERLRREFLG